MYNNNMKNIKDLKQMIKEPASKEWFEKHGSKKKEVAKKIRTFKGRPESELKKEAGIGRHKERYN